LIIFSYLSHLISIFYDILNISMMAIFFQIDFVSFSIIKKVKKFQIA
jgi:hypothetical protein